MPTKTTCATVIGVFHSAAEAQRAVQELKRAGYSDSEIGVVSQYDQDADTHVESKGSMADEGAAAGAAAGLGIGALWGIGIVAGMLPAIGPVIAGGALAAIAASAGTAAAAGGVVGALIGLGIPEKEAEYYGEQLGSGRTLVTVNCDRLAANQASRILDDHNVYDYSRRDSDFASDPNVVQRPNYRGDLVDRRDLV